MRKEQPGKRTDPGKLAKDREKILQSKKDIESPGPSLIDQIGANVRSFGLSIRRKQRARYLRKMGYGPDPQEEGARQEGFRKPRGDA